MAGDVLALCKGTIFLANHNVDDDGYIQQRDVLALCKGTIFLANHNTTPKD